MAKTKALAPIPKLFLNRNEAATACGVSPATISRAKNAGKLKAKKTAKRGGRELFSIQALEAWVNAMEDA